MKMEPLLIAVVGLSIDAPACMAQEPSERANLDAHGEVLCMAITADGQTLASGTWDRITVWNVAAGKEIHTLKGHSQPIGSVAFSPDSKVLVSGGRDNTIKCWDVATGQELRSLTGHIGRVASLGFSPDGRTLVSGHVRSSRVTSILWPSATTVRKTSGSVMSQNSGRANAK